MPEIHALLSAEAATAPGGALSFARVMELALYHPELGYYGAGPRRIGVGGDFFTAVSTGPLYGRLLARLARQLWLELGQPEDFHIFEQGAHDGQLALDIAAACDFPLILVEPNPRYQAVQKERLAGFLKKVRWVPDIGRLPPCPAFFLCNELPDAMPVHVLRRENGTWMERCVAWENGRASWRSLPLSNERLILEAERLPPDLPEGHCVEVGLAALDWMSGLAAAAFHGQVFIADYGLDSEEFHAPERHEGTLRRYREHQCDQKVLEELGQCDLTAQVNFTRLAETALAGGMTLRNYEHQGRFLGRLGMEWLRELDGQVPDATTSALLRQYQMLSHPAFLGRSFRVLLLDKSAP